MRIPFVLMLFVLSSCYSPKTDVEEDKHPEIPEFPVFSDPAIRLEKVMELPLSQKDNCTYLVKDTYFFIFNYPRTDSHQNDTNRLFIMNKGKLAIVEKWKNIPAINNLAFLDPAGNLYANNRKYMTPDYRYKKILPFYNLDDVTKKYEHLFHVGESEKDSALHKKIADEQTALQKNILDKTDHILLIPGDTNGGIYGYAAYGDNYLFNPGQKNSFFVSSNLLGTLKKDSAASSGDSDPLYVKLRPKIELSSRKTNFSTRIHNEFIDSVSFKIRDKIVSGNQWFSTGNHFVASFGYHPVYMYYYDVQIGNKTVSTKENHTKILASDPIRTQAGKYFLVSNLKEGKFQIYYLKN
ncbi:hypothetical protein JET18_02875 [Chryseobacterium sp. L7]|uniref:DUF4221 domain-containing protein n=1 Tax=Chryseobacterium endalhagicum TaxID=2797638 RepID=A0ABS1QBW9_9FLAO|nr:hypothetical protein [Chryseobacterium endalhagicum]MBL1219762.1 hypothetical protein [Chryseobacterium endalhagicum]